MQCHNLIGYKILANRKLLKYALKVGDFQKPKHVLFCFGGSDPTNTTFTALQALAKVKELSFLSNLLRIKLNSKKVAHLSH